MMTDQRLLTTGGTTGDGVNAVATLASDKGSLQVLIYNHTDGGAADSTVSTMVTVTVNNIPFANGSVRLRHYVLDNMHSNSYRAWLDMGGPRQPTQSQWISLRDAADLCFYDATMLTPGSALEVSFPVKNYSVELLSLSPP
jgi:xylan 1,4-beta-xylosidase